MIRDLFMPTRLGPLELRNRIVMAPMTRNRSTGNIPRDLAVTYYGQRAGAGLIITEGTSPSPNGLGYARMPGMFRLDHILGWTRVVQVAHQGVFAMRRIKAVTDIYPVFHDLFKKRV